MNRTFTTFKDRIRKYKTSKSYSHKFIYYNLRAAWRLINFFGNPRYRSEKLAPLKFNPNYFQHATATAYDRYPLIFKACAEYLRAIPQAKLLSFGCSTGEEVKTLAHYIPQATIIGIDINRWCLKQCSKNNLHAKHFYYHFSSAEFGEVADFDAIFCMAVFQRTERRFKGNITLANQFTFQKFENIIKVLDSKLKINGLLIIDHTDFRFSDTTQGRYYEPVNFEGNHVTYNRPLYDRNDLKIANSQTNYRVFVKKYDEATFKKNLFVPPI